MSIEHKERYTKHNGEFTVTLTEADLDKLNEAFDTIRYNYQNKTDGVQLIDAVIVFDQMGRSDRPAVAKTFHFMGKDRFIKYAVNEKIEKATSERNYLDVAKSVRVAHLLGLTENNPVADNTWRLLFENAWSHIEAQKNGDEWGYEPARTTTQEWEDSQDLILERWRTIRHRLPSGEDYSSTATRFDLAMNLLNDELAILPKNSMNGIEARAMIEALTTRIWIGPNQMTDFIDNAITSNPQALARSLYVNQRVPRSKKIYNVRQSEAILNIRNLYLEAFNILPSSYRSPMLASHMDDFRGLMDSGWNIIEPNLTFGWQVEPITGMSPEWLNSQFLVRQEWDKLKVSKGESYSDIFSRFEAMINLLHQEMEKNQPIQYVGNLLRAKLEVLIPEIWESPVMADQFLSNAKNRDMKKVGELFYISSLPNRNLTLLDLTESDKVRQVRQFYTLIFSPIVPPEASLQMRGLIQNMGLIASDSFLLIENRLIQDLWNIEPNTNKSQEWQDAQAGIIQQWNQIKDKIFTDPTELINVTPNSTRKRMEQAFGLLHDQMLKLKVGSASGVKVRAMIEALIPKIFIDPINFDEFLEQISKNRVGLNTMDFVGRVMFLKDLKVCIASLPTNKRPANSRNLPDYIFSKSEKDQIKKCYRVYAFAFGLAGGSSAPTDSSLVLQPYMEKLGKKINDSWADFKI